LRPCSLKRAQAETPRAVATLKDLLNYIDADCDYQNYRAVIWAVCSTGWKCADQLALDWSLTAEHRFEQSTFDALINSYDPDHPEAVTYGTLVYLAREGGYGG
jgi:putative DNA primase/helicase